MVTDAQLTDALRATIGIPEGVYGRCKMTATHWRDSCPAAGAV
jgi:hypothetical protein